MKKLLSATISFVQSGYVSAVLLFTIFSVTATAQEAKQEILFKVLAAQGDVATTKSTELSRLAAGKSLYKDQVVQINGKGYLGLMHKSGKSVEIRQPGTYKVWDLDAVVTKTASSSLAKKYAKYVFGELQRDDEKGLRKNHQQYMAVTGSVSRSANKSGVVKAYIPQNTTVGSTIPATISWAPVAKSGGTYLVTIQDMFDAIVWQKETADTSILMDFSSLSQLTNSRTGIIKIGTKNKGLKHAIGYPIKLMQQDDALKLKEEMVEFEKETPTSAESTALNELIQGYFFESAGLNLNALESFRSAMVKAPEIEDYRIQYLDYLTRSGLVATK